MDFEYILPQGFRINHGPLHTLIERAERVHTPGPVNIVREFLGSGHIQHPDREKVAILRGTGCERGKRTSAFWLAMKGFLNGQVLHDLDFGSSVGGIEQMQLGHEEAGINMY